MKKWANFFTIVGIISIIVGIVLKFLWFYGIITFLPLGIKIGSYFLFANTMFLLAIALGIIKLVSEEEL